MRKQSEYERTLIRNANMNQIQARFGGRFLDSPIDIGEFVDGYEKGVEAVDSEQPVSTRVVGNIPTAFDRGYKKGATDAKKMRGRTGVYELHIPFNEEVKRLRERYPTEYPETDETESVPRTQKTA